MAQGDRPIIYGLTMPPPNPWREDSRYAYWLKLADLALARAREEQERIKEEIRPQVERYRQIKRRNRPRKAA